MKIKLFFLNILLLFSCKENINKGTSSNQVLFTLLDPKSTGVDFNNKIKETTEEHLGTFNYIYNGAGVALIDINNDGLQDIYFTGNQVRDKLYLNKGGFKFEDISHAAGIDQFVGWHNSVSTCDINNDGFMDLYICSGGYKNTNI